MSQKRNIVPEGKRKAEGMALRAKWEAYKLRHPDASQEKIADKLGVSQSFLSGVLRGAKPIPLEQLVELAIELDFDPREVRPEIEDFMAKLIRAIEGRNFSLLEKRLKSLSPDRREAATKYLEFLLAEQSSD